MQIENEMTVEEAKKLEKKLEREHWETVFAKQLTVWGWDFIREYQFHPTRRWRFDFITAQGRDDPEAMLRMVQQIPQYIQRVCIAVEIEGAVGWGRHTRRQGFMDDCVKYNTAASMGWRVFRFPSEQVKDGSAIKFLMENTFT